MSPEEERRHRVLKVGIVFAYMVFIAYFMGLWILTHYTGFLCIACALLSAAIVAWIVL